MSIKKIFKEKTKPIIILSVFIVVAAVIYIVLANTILKPGESEQVPTIGNHGETMVSGRPFVMEPVDADDILSIKVTNDVDSFEYYLADDGQYYFKGLEKYLYNVSSNWQSENVQDVVDMLDGMSIVDNLIGISRYMLSSSEVVDYDRNNLQYYGLDNGGKATLELKHKKSDGSVVTEKVFFGNKTPSGSAYYVKLDGRDALYILSDTGVTRCVFTDVKSYIDPLCAVRVGASVYMEADELLIEKKNEKFVDIIKLTEQEREDCGKLFTHYMAFPEDYYPSSDTMEKLLQTYTDFKGTKVVEYDISSKISDNDGFVEANELFKLYSLLTPDNKWVNHIKLKYDSLGYDSDLFISEKLKVQTADESEEYIYYVFSPAMDTIVEVNASDIYWIEFDTIDFIEEHSFFAMIDNVQTMKFDYSGTSAEFELTGESNNLKVTCSTGIEVDTNNFRQLYKALLFATVEGEIDNTPDDPTLLVSVTVTLRNGTTNTYQYFGYTARKAYYTVNGAGHFYINRDYIKQLISACTGILNGETVTVSQKL